jgi:hypothetical protein
LAGAARIAATGAIAGAAMVAIDDLDVPAAVQLHAMPDVWAGV